MPIKLPCANCGNNLNIIKGTIVQCFQCEVKNIHFDSHDILSSFVQEIFGYSKLIEMIESNVSTQEINKRIDIVFKYFNDLLAKVNSFESFVLSKLYHEDVKQLHSDTISVSKSFGMLGILINAYILPHISGAIKDQYLEIRETCEIYQLAITGLRHNIEAKQNFKIEVSAELYQKASSNFESASDTSTKYSTENNNFHFGDEIIIFQISGKLCSDLKNILTESATYYSDNFEEYMDKLDEVSNPKARSLKNTIENIYEIANEIPKILEEIRVKKSILVIDHQRERILYHSEEIIEQLTNAKLWISDIEEIYKNLQSEILKLHGGQLFGYIKDYRREFHNRLSDAIKIYNKTITKIANTTLLDHTISSTDLFEELESGFSFSNLNPSEVIERIRYVKKDLLLLDVDLKEFLFEILDFGIGISLKAVNMKNVISSITDKHSSFDLMIYRYIKKILDGFIFERDDKRYTMQEQRNKFNISVRPVIENLAKVSFTIKEEDIPYPVFMELLIITSQLEVEKEYKVFFALENPSKRDVKNIKITFFIPNSFRIKTRFYDVKKIKPGQVINVETRIIPSEAGIYHFMAMAQYEYSQELFWMPGLKFKLKVLNQIELNADIDEDKLINDIYKKYGSGINKEELETKEYDSEIKTIDESIGSKNDELLPDLD